MANPAIPKKKTHDAEKTRERILLAALKEFAAKGLTGARVDEIARRAKINKQMLYHYFGNKKGLFRAVLRRKITQRRALSQTFSDDPTKNMPLLYWATCRETEWIRMLLWESVQTADGPVEDETARLENVRLALDDVRRRQQLGFLNPDFEPRFLVLVKFALTMFPSAFPHVTRLITGKCPDDPKFQRDYANFLEGFSAAFQPANGRPNTQKNPGASAPGND